MKQRVTADQLIAELNRAYEKQKGYDAANAFQGFPDGASGKAIRGYTTRGMWTPAHSRAYNEVSEKFELDDDA